MRHLPDFVLTIGVDGSGKSSFIKGLSTKLGYLVMEPTITDEARAFKIQHIDEPVDMQLVNDRRKLFRGLNNTFDDLIREKLKEKRVITTGSRLVTEISHAVMGAIVGGEKYSAEKIVDEWRSNDSLIPDEIVFTHAPIGIIQDRIQARISNGNAMERMIGFNSLYFLGHYQQALSDTTDILSQDIPVLRGDTSVISVDAGIAQFVS